MVFWNRRLAVPVLLDLLVVGAGLVFAVIFVFHGSSAGLKLGATNAAKQTFLATALTDLPAPELIRLAMVVALLGGLSRAALAFVLPFFRDTRVDPLSWVLIGSSIAGAAAVALFSHPGRSQGYFYATAIPLAALGSALGAERLVRGLGRRVAALVAAIGIAGGIAGYLVPQLVTGPLRPRAYTQVWEMVWIAVAVLVIVALVAAVAVGIVGRGRLGRGGLGIAVLAAVACSILVTGSSSAVAALATSRTPAARVVTLSSGGAVSQAQIDVARYIRDHSAHR